jgi:hypothetical protein
MCVAVILSALYIRLGAARDGYLGTFNSSFDIKPLTAFEFGKREDSLK